MRNAFASIVQARPCPTFGRPVRPGAAPSTTARYFSAYPSDSASRRTPCPPKHVERRLQVGLGCIRLSPSCPHRRLHTFLSLRPARRYPCCRRRESADKRRGFVAGATIRGLTGAVPGRCRPMMPAIGLNGALATAVADRAARDRRRPRRQIRDRRRRERGAGAMAVAIGGAGGVGTVQNVRSSPAASVSHLPAVSSLPCSWRRYACIWSR